MCGILGRINLTGSNLEFAGYKRSIDKLYQLSESRGKEASGLCCMTDEVIKVLKADIAASKMVKRNEYKEAMSLLENSKYRLVMGHARMITNGDSSNANNNQPVVRGDLVIIHNGIIVNDEKIWNENPDLDRTAVVDTEVFAALMEKHDYKRNLIKAFFESLEEIEGSLSAVIVDRESDWVLLYTNIGSLYVATSSNNKDYVFASERYILEETLRGIIAERKCSTSEYTVRHFSAGEGMLLNVTDGAAVNISSNMDDSIETASEGKCERTIEVSSIITKKQTVSDVDLENERNKVSSMIGVNIDAIHKMRRCTRCLLPETFPGIHFDEHGVCSVCNSYQKKAYKGKEALINDIAINKVADNRYDCIAPISGGRDSCYILHYLVKELHLRPVAYTYDWGLVTDLARRNIQRMCAALGVEHVLISADISKKRNNVRKNVEAWLRRPELGTVPLFMAGDKQFFYYAQLLKKQMKVDNVIFGMNALEETQFKAGFIGVNAGKKDDLYYHFSSKNKTKLAMGYGMEFLKNPAYFNASLVDSFTGFLSYFALPQKYIRFFDYIEWNQKEIEDVLINQYNWETASDTEETWRIGDGTAPFYNYIYYRMAGFTEFDTFKSNQIREGTLTREEAMQQIDESNQISIDGFLWYCHTIGIDPVNAIDIINKQKPLYEK